MIGKNKVGGFAEKEVAIDFDTELAQAFDFFDEADGVHDDAVADDAGFAATENSRGHKVEDIFLAFDEDGVAGVVTALRADDDIRLLRQNINDFALAFIAPLGAHENCIGHYFSFLLRLMFASEERMHKANV